MGNNFLKLLISAKTQSLGGKKGGASFFRDSATETQLLVAHEGKRSPLNLRVSINLASRGLNPQ